MATRKVLVVGSGGREHALALRLLDSPSVQEVIVAPGNAGTAFTQPVPGKVLRGASGDVVELARREAVDLVVVGPEGPLCDGVVDALAAAGVLAYGPSRAAARLEGSKVYMKRFAERHGILTAPYAVVEAAADLEQAVRSFAEPPVVKADGLCAGKGVVVARSHDEAIAAGREMLSGQRFGAAGRSVVLEARLSGSEASIHAICDGERAVLLPAAQDHKRIGDGDTGPNTGGMGTYCPAPLVTPEVWRTVERDVVERTLAGMAAEGVPFRGTLFAGLMIDDAGRPHVLEFNVRFGDPETQVLMNTIDGDLAAVLEAAAHGRLEHAALRPNGQSAVCVVLAAAGYPDAPSKGDVISGLDRAGRVDGTRIYHAGTALDGDRLVTAGGRVLGITGYGATLAQAHARAYQAADLVAFSGKQMRRDIAARALT